MHNIFHLKIKQFPSAKKRPKEKAPSRTMNRLRSPLQSSVMKHSQQKPARPPSAAPAPSLQEDADTTSPCVCGGSADSCIVGDSPHISAGDTRRLHPRSQRSNKNLLSVTFETRECFMNIAYGRTDGRGGPLKRSLCPPH